MPAQRGVSTRRTGLAATLRDYFGRYPAPGVRYLAPAELEKSLRSACREILESVAHNHIRIDGKEMRGTISFGKKHATVQVVSIWLAEESISFGQVQMDKKSNKITAILRLLDQLDGCNPNCRLSISHW